MDPNPAKAVIVFVVIIQLVALILILPAGKRGPGVLQAWAQQDLSTRVMTAETIIADWPPDSKKLSKVFIEQYGQPTRFGPNSLVWEYNKPWKRTVIHRGAWTDPSGVERSEILEQTVPYMVPPGSFERLASFDERITSDDDARELTSRHDNERLNYLALNLADEIIIGAKTPAQARAAYRMELRLMEAGKASSYVEGLRFMLELPIQ